MDDTKFSPHVADWTHEEELKEIWIPEWLVACFKEIGLHFVGDVWVVWGMYGSSATFPSRWLIRHAAICETALECRKLDPWASVSLIDGKFCPWLGGKSFDTELEAWLAIAEDLGVK